MDIALRWSPEAIEDLESIAQYIARDSESYARAVVSEIVAGSRTIKDFPSIGRVVPEIGDERIRERFIHTYRVIYRLEDQEILIVAVIHGWRLLENLSGRFD